MKKENLKNDESVGTNFSLNHLNEARKLTLRVIEEAAKYLKEGLTENELISKISVIQEEMGAQRAWHKPQVRFGQNTNLPFGQIGIINNSLKRDDIAFIDLGLVFKEHEGDVARTYSIGKNERMKQCCEDVETIWRKVKEHWKQTNSTGEELYKYAEKLANKMSWNLVKKKANGHRISDFPHIVRNRKTSIDELIIKPQENRWILEIQILEGDGSFGAFYEDLL